MAHNLRNRLKLKEDSTSNLSATPVKSLATADIDYSPVYLRCTQESLDNVDVLWDWNSPQSKTRTNRRPKRIVNAQKLSPKLPLKKHTNSTNAHRTLDSMRDELLAFQEEYEPDQFLTASNLDCSFNNNDELKEKSPSPSHEQPKLNLSDDLFDDSLEQDLLLVSQQIEEKLKEVETEGVHHVPVVLKSHQTPVVNRQAKISSPRTLTKSFSSDAFLDSPLRTPQRFKANDSFDVALEAFDDSFVLPALDAMDKNSRCEFLGSAGSSATVRNVSPAHQSAVDGALKFKTKSLSFGHSYVKKSNEDVMREEIEKRRKEALAKLRSKQIASVLSDSDTSPITCSPEEIEIKRQQARAKLEQKKQQELIERNRLEALKKLETRRKQVGKLSQASTN